MSLQMAKPVLVVALLSMVIGTIEANSWTKPGKHHHKSPPPARCGYGSVCNDPVMKTQTGQQFYFHGRKNADFCLVSDTEVHINAHFIGLKGATVQHDFTWVQSLGVLFAGNQLYIGARKVANWDQAEDQLILVLNSDPVVLPAGAGAVWDSPLHGVTVARTEDANAITVDVAGYVRLTVFVTPVSEEDDAAHSYGVPFGADCMAHLDVSFQFARLSEQAHGVLGQTYNPGFQMPPTTGSGRISTMGDQDKYITSGVMAPDCAVSKFNLKLAGDAATASLLELAQPVTCGSGGAFGLGMVCRR